MVKSKQLLTEGPIFVRFFLFTVPIIASGLLQVFYNMADNIVVGSFSNDPLALGAVGSTGTLTTLIVRLLLGFATGSGVVIAHCYGERAISKLSKSIHTAITFAFISGILLALLGFCFSDRALTLIGTKPELHSRALLYFRIICIGIPASTVYNFGSAILRAVGDSKTPLYILMTTGLANVLMNLLFVIVFGMTVDGVALATIISQYMSAATVMLALIRRKEEGTSFSFKKMEINPGLLKRIIIYGLPAGLQSTIFSLANILITSSVNTLPTTSVTANTIAGNIDGLVHTAQESFSHSAVTFAGQNLGAKKFDRIKKISLYSIIQVTAVGILLGQLILLFGDPIASLYINPAEENKELILEAVREVMGVILNTYFLCGIMNVLTGLCRGLGNSFAPMIIGIAGVCGVRIIWILFVFPLEAFNSLTGLYISMPLTWVFCVVALLITFIITWKKRVREAKIKEETEATAHSATE